MLPSAACVVRQDTLLTKGLPPDIVGDGFRPNVRSITQVKFA
jgi:hypothetical protein